MRRPITCFAVSAIALLAANSALKANPAIALDVPPRKAGHWEMKLVVEGSSIPAQLTQLCIDADTDKLMSTFANAATKNVCSRSGPQKVGDTYVFDSVCKVGPATNTMHAVITGDFNAAYTAKILSVSEGGPKPRGARPDGKYEMTVEARWTGACKPDQEPGDIIMNGHKVNVRGLSKVPETAPKR